MIQGTISFLFKLLGLTILAVFILSVGANVYMAYMENSDAIGVAVRVHESVCPELSKIKEWYDEKLHAYFVEQCRNAERRKDGTALMDSLTQEFGSWKGVMLMWGLQALGGAMNLAALALICFVVACVFAFRSSSSSSQPSAQQHLPPPSYPPSYGQTPFILSVDPESLRRLQLSQPRDAKEIKAE